MADIKTAEEWKKVQAEQFQKYSELNDQRIRLLRLADTSAGRTKVMAQSALGQVEAQLAETRDAIDFAKNQAETAMDSPPGTLANPITSSNPTPANDQPGNNTDVDEFGDLDGAVELQKNIALNTEGQPVLAEDGSVAEGVAINPETGETYFTGDTSESVSTGVSEARISGALDSEVPFPNSPDWRVRIALAPSANYLYKDPQIKPTDLLYPLLSTNGVIFPYVPNITVNYNANYEATDLTHSNFKIYNYRNSGIESINLTGDFTAQDTNEANYVLAVIHFFRSCTKMFYGKDENPIRGTPPPLVYLSGYGEYGFDNHAMVIQNFTLTYPSDVDYINAGYNLGMPPSLTPYSPPVTSYNPSASRLYTAKLNPGGMPPPPEFTPDSSPMNVTRVPSKIQLTINALPIVTRNNISNTFSLKKYATGELLKGSLRQGGGIW